MKPIICLIMTFLTINLHAAEFDSTIPVLDMNDYFNPETKSDFVQKLDLALQDVGFFAVINTGVDQAILDEAYEASKQFFALPFEAKMLLNDPFCNGQRGYIPGESAKGQSSSDVKEFYHIGREMTEEQKARLNYWVNIWPEDFNLKEPMNNLYGALQTYMGPLQQAMAEALGEHPELFNEMTIEGDVLMRSIHYPANPPLNELWAAEHTDIDLFTILPRATAEGLQVKNSDGVWVDVVVPDNAFIINGGDMLENISNGLFKSGLHRVVAKKSGYERYSMVYFVHPRSNDRLDPLPSAIARTGGVKKYANATRLELLEERLVDLGLASYPMMQHLAESGLMERLLEVGRASPKAMKKLKDASLASEQVLNALEVLNGI